MGKVAAAIVTLLVLLGTAAGGWWLSVGAPRARERAAAATVDAVARAWEARDWPALAARTDTPARAASAHRDAFAGLELDRLVVEPTDVRVEGESAEGALRVTLRGTPFGTYAYDSRFALAHAGGQWTVRWTPAVVHPAMVSGGRLVVRRVWPPRAPILGRDGRALVTAGEVVTVGVAPARIAEPAEVVDALVAHAGADRGRVEALLGRDDLRADWFYPVVELPRARFDEVDSLLRPVPGIVFQAGETARTGAAGTFAQHLLGEVGEADAERAAALGPPYQEGDLVGLSGLEAALEEQLAGRPEIEVAVVDREGEVVEVVHRVPGVAGEPARITLDPRVQAAAEAALARVDELTGGTLPAGDAGEGAPGEDAVSPGTPGEDAVSPGAPAALVAVDVATAEVLAAVNRPAAGFDRALRGRYPPGSTFKIVTAAALLGAGVSPDDLVDCPAEARAGGRAFRNAGGIALGPITLREAFAVSCNTAFVGQAAHLGDGLAQAAAAFGFDGRDHLVLPSFGGSFPEPSDTTELAAAAIGQARVEASPLHMAGVAAAVATGQWRPPRLVTAVDAAVRGDEPPRPLPGDPETLRALMREVVASGTGRAAALPGEPVAGKTGSAEFGTAEPPETHAWFVGFRGDVAFAVLVEGGGAGGEVAAPVARAFLEALEALD